MSRRLKLLLGVSLFVCILVFSLFQLFVVPLFLQIENLTLELETLQRAALEKFDKSFEKSDARDIMNEDKLYRKLFSSALHPFKLRPFYFRAEETSDSVITLATICTHKRREMLPFLAERWGGPLSITYHLERGLNFAKEFQELKQIYYGSDFLRKFASIHLIVDDHQLQLNLWRNIARFYSNTPSVLILDVEFVPNPDLYPYVSRNWDKLEKMLNNKTAFVLPAYELVNYDLNGDIPETKSKLIQLASQNQAQMFHSYWYQGQGHTNHPKWESTNVMYPIETYYFKYEPYLIYPQDAPFCDERFFGYGSNKCACVYELVVAGYDLQVLPESFIVHRPHGEYALTPEQQEKRNKENDVNNETFKRYMEDLRLKYGTIIMGSKANGTFIRR